MKTFLKTGLITFLILALAGCQKTELLPVPADTQESNYKAHEYQNLNPAELFTDKDKCKKCHTKTMVDWDAPFMSDKRYNSIEELIADFDFVNYVHLSNSEQNSFRGISDEKKQEVIDYLHVIISQSSDK